MLPRQESKHFRCEVLTDVAIYCCAVEAATSSTHSNKNFSPLLASQRVFERHLDQVTSAAHRPIVSSSSPLSLRHDAAADVSGLSHVESADEWKGK